MPFVKKSMSSSTFEMEGLDSTFCGQSSLRKSNGSFGKHSWLLSTIADLDERIKALASKSAEEDDVNDTFAERAESYYRKRPQLLSLLQDLYNAYTALSDRYVQVVAKHQHNRKHSSQTSSDEQVCYDQDEDITSSQIDSDAESSLSYQKPLNFPTESCITNDDSDVFIAELVMKNVECDILLDEVNMMERHCCESSRKIELQKSLLEVLESERLVLLNENAGLMYKVAAMMEENKGLAAESAFVKRKAGEMARCMMKMREDHRVYMLSSKIEDLQGQIYRLEKRNREYYEQQLVRKDQVKEENKCRNKGKSKAKNGNEVGLEACFQIGNQKLRRNGDEGIAGNKKMNGGKKISRWWGRVKNMDMFLCGLNSNSA